MARKGFKIADAYVEIHADKDALRDEIKGVPGSVGGDADKAGTDVGKRFGKGVGKGAGPESDKAGRDSGGKLAKGFQMSFLRNSPLIVAAIGGALAAGAPLALAGATVLFAGIGGVAAAQSQKVQQAWVGLWQQIKSESISDASVLVPVYERMAQKIGASFERMRPQIRATFADSAPLIDQFTNSLTKSAENALPGFQRAVERGKPVMAGFGAFVEDTGQGLTDFFDNMSEHSPAAGKAFDALGRIVGALLPIMGTFLGQGAELASIVLPPLATALEVVDDALKSLGPMLPIIVAGFSAMKIAKTASGWITGIGGSLDGFAKKTGTASLNSGKLGSALSAVGSAAPIIGVGIGLVGAAMMKSAQETAQLQSDLDSLYDRMRQGGRTGAAAAADLQTLTDRVNSVGHSFDITGGASGYFKDQLSQARGRAHELWAEMDPLAQAQSKVAEWSATLSSRLADESASSEDVAIAKERYKYWSDQQKQAEADLQLAIDGVTAAMVDEANQAMSSIDSSFAYKNSLNQLEDAQAALADAIKKHGANSEEAQRASLGLEEQNYATAKAFGQQQADLSGLSKDTEEYARMVQTSTLQELYRLRDAAGPQMAAALQQQINVLEASGVKLGETTSEAAALTKKMQGLGVSITQVPGQKYIVISAPTAAQEAAIKALGLHVQRLPNGQIIVSVSGVATVNAQIDWAARNRESKVSVRTVMVPERSGGGPIDKAVHAASGKLVGPGDGSVDTIPAVGPGGAPWMLANDEWVVKAASSRKYGDALMAAVNAGTASISAPGLGQRGPSVARQIGSGGSTIHIGSVTVPISGVVDLSDTRELKRLGEKIREIIIGLERETK